MRKIYENLDIEVLFFHAEDVITFSMDSNDNVEDMPEFPEFM